jgi:RNA polymerase sigma-54 factor
MNLSLSMANQQLLFISPALRQSIEILQMSSQDLFDFLSEQMNENPILELQPNSVDLYNKKSLSERGQTGNPDWWQNVTTSHTQTTLYSHLKEQLNDFDMDKKTREICKFLIDSLDGNGYLSLTPAQIAEHLRIPIPQAALAIHIIQQMEPAGVAASSISECLLLQLTPDTDQHPLVRQLIENDLPDLAKRKMVSLAKKYNVEPSSIERALHTISQLQPKPGASFFKEETAYLIPDIHVIKNGERFDVEINDVSFPSLAFNSEYLAMMSELRNKQASSYLKQGWKKAKSLMDSIEYRKLTLLQMTKIIFDMQLSFCHNGPSHLAPLTMSQVANRMGVHESTVSRAVNHKYALTPWGIFELKHFFSASIKQQGGSLSSLQVKERVRAIIEHEDKSNPLSDQKIADKLKTENILASRRVVTKYREQLRILTAAERKQYSS